MNWMKLGSNGSSNTFSPAGYTANLTAAPGTKIGSVLAVVKAKALGGALLPLAGDVVVANPTDPAIVAAATKCTGTPTHGTIWVLNTSLQGQTVAIPVFVAFSRMYRGMHHPLDVLGGVVIGIAALTAMVLVSRATGSAAADRDGS